MGLRTPLSLLLAGLLGLNDVLSEESFDLRPKISLRLPHVEQNMVEPIVVNADAKIAHVRNLDAKVGVGGVSKVSGFAESGAVFDGDDEILGQKVGHPARIAVLVSIIPFRFKRVDFGNGSPGLLGTGFRNAEKREG